MFGWKAVLGLVSRNQEEAQRLSLVQLKSAMQTKMPRCRLQGLKPEVGVTVGFRLSDRMEEGRVLLVSLALVRETGKPGKCGCTSLIQAGGVAS